MNEYTADPSHDLDLEIVFEAAGTTAEMEAIAIRGVLDANGIPSVLMGAPQYPNLPFYVKVPRASAAQAKEALRQAREAGPEAAEEAERASETGALE
jgi:hypothetical protein